MKEKEREMMSQSNFLGIKNHKTGIYAAAGASQTEYEICGSHLSHKIHYSKEKRENMNLVRMYEVDINPFPYDSACPPKTIMAERKRNI